MANERSIEEIKQSIALIKNLQKNDGWKYLSKLMEDEILPAAYNLSSAPNMSKDEINWRRGALWASRKLVEMPNVLEIKLKNDLAFATLDETEKDKVKGASAPINK